MKFMIFLVLFYLLIALPSGAISQVPIQIAHGRISLGRNHTCAITTAGVRCWGIINWSEAYVPKDLRQVSYLASGEEFVCALTNGKDRCWSSLRNPHQFSPSHQARVEFNSPQGIGPVSQIAAGSSHACALANNRVYCWWAEERRHHTPFAVPKNLGPVTKIAAGDRFVCAVEARGNTRCWDANAKDIWITQWNSPLEIRARWNNVCIQPNLQYGTRPQCYFRNAGIFSHDMTTPSDLGRVYALSVGGSGNSCALTYRGPRCWGNNDGYTVFPNGLQDMREIETSDLENFCALSGSKLKCWGPNSYGQSTVPADLAPIY